MGEFKLSKRTEVIISLAILAGAGLFIVAILTSDGSERWSDLAPLGILFLFFIHDWKNGHYKWLKDLGTKAKIVLILTVLVSACLIAAAVVTYVREGDWPAKYVYAAAITFLVVAIAVKPRARRDQAQ